MKHSQDGTQRKVRIADVVPHGHDAVTVHPRVLVEYLREKVELLLDGKPGLFSLATN